MLPPHNPTMPDQPHHNQKGPEPRVRLGGGPFIDPITKKQLDIWHGQGLSYGEIIDRLTTYAVFSSFNPITLKHQPTKNPQSDKL
jgi:hypothetical protein